MSNKVLIDNINPNNLPILFDLPLTKIKSIDYIISEADSYPRFNLGFHHYVHQNKSKLEVLKEFNEKKKVYLVMNPFEVNVEDYDKDIMTVVSDNLKTSIISEGFFKAWELQMTFDLLQNKSQNIAYLAEGPGSFIQSFHQFRSYYENKKDNHYAMTLHDPKDGSYVPEIDPRIIKEYSNLEVMKTDKKNNGDVRDPDNIESFMKQFKIESKMDLVIADGEFAWNNENTQEQEATPLILGEIYGAMRLLKKDGNFVVTAFETYTDTMLNVLTILSDCFKNISIYKPLTSKGSSSEKFIVCQGYKQDKKYIKLFDKILNEIKKDKNNNLSKVYIDEMIGFRVALAKANNDLAHKQLKAINDITDFIDSGDYHGDVYIERNSDQRDTNEFWLKMYFPSQKEYINQKSIIKSLSKQMLERNLSRIDKMIKLIN